VAPGVVSSRPNPRNALPIRADDPAFATVAVIGQGYVGWPTPMQAVTVGFDVVEYEDEAERVRRLQEGHSYVKDDPVPSIPATNSGRHLNRPTLTSLPGAAPAWRSCHAPTTAAPARSCLRTCSY
jgi:hypothetical protein